MQPASDFTFPLETTTVTYTAKDWSPGSPDAQETFTVTVIDAPKPVLSGRPSDITKEAENISGRLK